MLGMSEILGEERAGLMRGRNVRRFRERGWLIGHESDGGVVERRNEDFCKRVRLYLNGIEEGKRAKGPVSAVLVLLK
jgi:hypothetical protein